MNPPETDDTGSPASRRARRRALRVTCTACGHPWSEHPGSPYEIADPAACGECVYELEHGFTQRAACDRPVPEGLAGR